MLRAPEVGARSPPPRHPASPSALQSTAKSSLSLTVGGGLSGYGGRWGSATLGSPCPSRYRLEFGAPWFSGRVGACPRPEHRCRAKSYHLFIGSTSGGATRPPSRPTSAFCPCSGLVAWLCANKGAPPRLPFRSPPSRSARWWRLPAPLGQSGLVGALPLPRFFRLPL